MIGSFESGATVYQVAKHETKKLSLLFEVLQGSNSEFKLITPKPIHFGPIVILMSRQSFRHLKHQNLSTGDDFIHSSGIIFLVPLLATMEAVAPLANDPIMSGRSIRLFRHLEH